VPGILRVTEGAGDSEQGAVVAFRKRGGQLEICLIRRVDSGKWGIPKGIVDPGETPEETALHEALEEAGLRGHLVGNPIGSYVHQKWGTAFRVVVYLMEVITEEDTWEEMDIRERSWVPPADATHLLGNHRVRPLLGRAFRVLGEMGAATDHNRFES
jgi:phosphohistidine phosphatase